MKKFRCFLESFRAFVFNLRIFADGTGFAERGQMHYRSGQPLPTLSICPHTSAGVSAGDGRGCCPFIL